MKKADLYIESAFFDCGGGEVCRFSATKLIGLERPGHDLKLFQARKNLQARPYSKR
jgi:hypothetical protein